MMTMTTKIKKTYFEADMLTAEKEQQLLDSLKWFANWHGNNKLGSVLTTFLTGAFKVPVKEAMKILKDAVKLKLVKFVNGVAIII